VVHPLGCSLGVAGRETGLAFRHGRGRNVRAHVARVRCGGRRLWRADHSLPGTATTAAAMRCNANWTRDGAATWALTAGLRARVRGRARLVGNFIPTARPELVNYARARGAGGEGVLARARARTQAAQLRGPLLRVALAAASCDATPWCAAAGSTRHVSTRCTVTRLESRDPSPARRRPGRRRVLSTICNIYAVRSHGDRMRAGNQIGDVGATALAKGVKASGSLKELWTVRAVGGRVIEQLACAVLKYKKILKKYKLMCALAAAGVHREPDRRCWCLGARGWRQGERDAHGTGCGW
jgi:hypothetical protein